MCHDEFENANHTNAKETTMNAKRKRNPKTDNNLTIAKKDRRASVGGTWVSGTFRGHTFSALVFSEHAECPSFELGESRISKLWIKRRSNDEIVCNFDRGWDIRPTDADAEAVVEFLAAVLAEQIFAK